MKCASAGSVKDSRVLHILETIRTGFEREAANFIVPTLRSFPRGSCVWCSRFVTAILNDKGFQTAKCKVGFRGRNHNAPPQGHEWTVCDDYDIDITANQFAPDCDEPIVYAIASPFHAQFCERVRIEPVNIDEFAECDGVMEDFARVKSWFRATYSRLSETRSWE